MVFCKALPLVAAGTTALLAAGAVVAGAPAGAQPPLHHVRYTVGASQDIMGNIYYREVDPPNWADYSHNPYQYSPKAEVFLGPNKPWVKDVMLADPDDWAMVVVGLPGYSTPALNDPGFVCELRVDDVVVKTAKGTKGALCSIRSW
jgi:hypothetical protein